MSTQRKDASEVPAFIQHQDGGGFLAIASTPDVDRDGEVIAPGCFNPLPKSIPVHLDHTMSAATLVGRGRPYYEGTRLLLDANLASTADAQVVRQKMADGVIDSMSIVFRGLQWEDIDGVRTCIRGELLAADLVSIPSQPNARVLSMRSYRPTASNYRKQVDEAIADAVLVLAEIELARAKHFMAQETASPPTAPDASWSSYVRFQMTDR